MTSMSPRVVCEAGTIDGLATAHGNQFRGIPYAEAPLGVERFRAPRRRARFDEPFAAVEWGASPQRVPLFTATFIPEPSIPGDDILNLNVFTPADARPGDDRPVVVWIHGGGFRAGSTSGEWYRGEAIVASGAIMVVPSYRVAFDGFGWLDAEHDNRGIRDLVMALEWVRDNIRAFGGDPERVTISGQSAGGAAVLALLAAPSAAGLFARAWSMSGPLAAKTVAEADAFTRRFAERLGIARSAEGFSALSDTELQRALAEGDPDSTRLHGEGPVPGGLYVTPVLGTETLPGSIVAGIREVGGGIPFVLGATTEEFVNPAEPLLGADEWDALAGTWGPAGERYGRDMPAHVRTPGRIATDALFRSAVAAAVEARAGSPAPTWVYDIPWQPPALGRAAHCIDVPLFLGVAGGEIGRERLGESEPLASRMHEEFLAFLHDGDPGWPAVGVDARPTRIYDEPVGVADDVFGPLSEFGALWSRDDALGDAT